MRFTSTPLILAVDDAYVRLSTQAHAGAFGANDRPMPSEAMLKHGNYKKGRTTLHGLNIVIEQPQGSIRTGVSRAGKEWSSRMAAHYGYFAATMGADGDEVDVFIGPFPESTAVYVINQRNADGSFDEHKVMLGFPDAMSAKRAYLASYERGWTGLQSIVQISISQLAWWLKSGGKQSPLTASALPHDGSQAMTKKVYWNGADPDGATFDQVLYEVRRADGPDGLLLDSVSLSDIYEDSEGILALDALVVENAQMGRMAERIRAIMDRTGTTVKAPAVQVTEPFKARGVTNVAAVFELSDGQTVSVFFHNPDTTPNKIAPADELISWKWLLNKRDITIVVAPEKGQDLNPRVVAQRIMRLAEKNSAAFQKANVKRSERLGNIQALRDRIAEKETTLKGLIDEIEAAKLVKEHGDVAPVVSDLPEGWTEATPGGMATNNDPANGGIVDVNLASGKWFAVANKEGVGTLEGFDTRAEAFAALGEAIANYRFNPLTPENYAKVLADQALQLDYQDELDAYFQGRIIDVRNALRGMGWDGDKFAPLMKNGAKLEIHTQRIGHGSNVVGVKYYVTGDVAQGGSDATQDLPEFTALEIAQDIDTKVKVVPVLVELSGNELGEFPDTPEGKKSLREAVKAHLQSLRGKWVCCDAIGKDIEIRKRGIKETLAFSGDVRKLKILAAIEQLIKSARPINPENFREENNRPHVKESLAYYRLQASPVLNGESIPVEVIIEEDVNGLLHYDLLVPKTKTALDSAEVVALISQNNYSWIGVDAILDEAGNDSQETFDAVGGELVLNLFIAGEQHETLEVDPITQVDAAYLFDNATDAFKERVAESIDKPSYSEFATAKAMDEKAKGLGAEIHWGMGAMLDSVGEDDDETPEEEAQEHASGHVDDDFDVEAEFDACPVEDLESA